MSRVFVFLLILVAVSAKKCQCDVTGCIANTTRSGCIEGAVEQEFRFTAFSTKGFGSSSACSASCSVERCNGDAPQRGIFLTQPLLTRSRCKAECFHKDTLIEYQGRLHTLYNTTCYVPHVVVSKGYWVQCGSNLVRATGNHLFFTVRGLVPLKEVQVGDEMYTDLAETQVCTVTLQGREETEQEYFGLNCFDSQVLASGVKASLYEKNHVVPATWMFVMSRLLGLEKASQLGEQLLSFFQ